MKIKKLNEKKFIGLYISLLLFISVIVIIVSSDSFSYELEDKDYIYLSDMDYMQEDSYAFYGVKYDSSSTSSMSALLIDGETKVFAKSVAAWAPSEVVYDISEISDEFTMFSAYIGIDKKQQSTYYNDGASVFIYTSEDGENWTDLEIENTDYLTAYMDAVYVNVSIEGANYIKLVGSIRGSNWWSDWYDDVTYANAKFTKKDYIEDVSYNEGVKTVSEYDEIIKSYDQSKTNTDEYRHLLLKREFVNNAGYDEIQALLMVNSEYAESLFWIFDDYQNLLDYTLGGTPDGSYFSAIKIWNQLYFDFKDDLSQTGVTSEGVEYSELNKKILFSLSLTHSTTVGLWAGGRTGNPSDPNDSDASIRYEIFKKLHNDDKIDNYIFDHLEIEEMRFVMNNIVDDESIEWFNDFITSKENNRNPYMYITYRFGYEYSDPQYYSQENYSKWDEKYQLGKYNITYEMGYPKPWIVMEEGGVCGAISKTGSNIFGSFGVPSSVISQPGHAAYIVYSLDSDGNAVYSIWNNISGWAQSGKTEKLTVRMPNGWGSGLYVGGYPASYILLAQGALNDFETYEASEIVLLEAKVYANDKEKLEKIYRNSLNESSINLDAWIGLVTLYINNENGYTDEDKYNLATQIKEALVYYPRPMYDLMTTLNDNISEVEYQVSYAILLEEALNIGIAATSEESYQYAAVREVASFIKGNVDNDIASFSFDGEDAGKIVLSDKFTDSSVTWDYSLDGGITYTQVTGDFAALTEDEIKLINIEDDIIIHIVGLNYDEQNLYYIDVESGIVPSTIYNNDNENIVAGATSYHEWRMTGDTNWNSFAESTPNLTGNKSVEVRTKATGLYIASEYTTLEYRENIFIAERNYVSITKQSLFDYSTAQDEAGHYATNALDGNIHTIWHSTYDGDDFDRYITIELEKSIYLKALDYVPRLTATNGIVGAAELYGSIDGENYFLLTEAEGWGCNNAIKTMELDESTLVKYIKFKATSTYSTNSNTYVSALMFNIYEDTTKLVEPTADVEYNILVSTNNSVTATLVNESEEITITNNNGSREYVFTENGEFTFTFISATGVEGSAVAKVTNIDKTAPTLKITYSDTVVTNGEIEATLSANEEITVTNNNGSKKYTFTENGEFTFNVVDEAGNVASIIAKVSNIDKEAPTATIEYSTKLETTGSVKVTLTNISSDIDTITNNGTYTFTKNGAYSFTLVDKAGNTTTLTAIVDWIKEENLTPEDGSEPESDTPIYPSDDNEDDSTDDNDSNSNSNSNSDNSNSNQESDENDNDDDSLSDFEEDDNNENTDEDNGYSDNNNYNNGNSNNQSDDTTADYQVDKAKEEGLSLAAIIAIGFVVIGTGGTIIAIKLKKLRQ